MRKVKLTRNLFELYKELERLEEVLDFSVYYSLEDAFHSHHFLPGFYFEQEYFEIQEDDNEELNVLNFGFYGCIDEGIELSDKEVGELVSKLKGYKEK